MVERLLLCNIPSGSRILDVCCGTGLVARHLADRGFQVTGVDASAEMLAFAKSDVPEAEFYVADVRSFQMPAIYHGAICTFDSLSYMLTDEDLRAVLGNVHAALRPGGSFLFDLSMEDAYRREWGRECTIVEEGEAHFVRGTYDAIERLGETRITSFVCNGAWRRVDATFRARCHTPDTVISCLRKTGFATVRWYQSDQDATLHTELGPSRACFCATKELL